MEIRQCAFGHFYDASIYRHCPYCGEVNRRFSEPLVIPRESLEAPVPPREGGRSTAEIRPVAGWLVCTAGPNRGRSHEIHSDNNFVGRGGICDIDLEGDGSISQGQPFVVTYDARDRAFYCGLMNGCDLVRLNGTPLLSTARMNAGDKLSIGRTELLFVPLCGPDFDWNETTPPIPINRK